MQKTIHLGRWRKYSRFTFIENTISNFPKVSSFVLLVYASSVASRTILWRLLFCLNFTFDSEDFVSTNEKGHFREPWQQHKQLKTMEISEAWSDTLILTMKDIYIIFNLNPLIKFISSSRSTEFKDTLFEHLSNYNIDHPNQHKNSHKLYNETRHPVLSLMESQGKLWQPHDLNFPMEGKPL